MSIQKVAIVTGASKGLGRATAKRLAEGGFLVIAVARTQTLLDELAKESEQILPFSANLKNSEEIQQIIQFALEKGGRLDLLVNNAGLGHFGTVEELTEEQFEEMYQVNLKAAFLACKYSIPYLKETEGHIINISSVAGLEAFARGAGYCASKFGLQALSDALTQELKPFHVRVTTFCPGSIKTDFGRKKDYALDPEYLAEVLYQIATAPKEAIWGQVVMRPQVPHK